MEDILAGLDADQLAVVAHREGAALVVAGPGSGKTRSLVARAAALLAEGVSPEAIMMVTFTRNAAATMLRRASAADRRAAYLTAGTFHSIGAKVVQANHALLGFDKEVTVLDGEDTEQILRGIIDDVKGKEKGWPRASTVGKIISYSVNTGVGIEEAMQTKWPKYVELLDGIVAVAERLAEYKMARGLVAYDDIITLWTALLEDEDIGPELRSRWKYVMIDEYQDGNALLTALTKALLGVNGNLMAVGDTSQAIYGFRGSSPNTMKELSDHHGGARLYELGANYRSTVEIVDVGAAIDRTMDNGFPRTLRSATGRRGARPGIVDVRDAAAEAELIAETIQDDRDGGGDYADHAVLVRSMNAARRIEAEFITRRIPFKVQGGTRIDEAAHIRDLLSIGRLSSNLAHEPAWIRLLTRFDRIGDGAAASMASQLVASRDAADAVGILAREGPARRTSFQPLMDALTAVAADGLPADRLEAAIGHMEPVWAEVWTDDWKSRARDLEAVIVIAQEHARMEDFLTAITLDGSIDRENAGSGEKLDEAPVTISTVHGAKGLEWPKVHVPSLVSGSIPSNFSQTEDERQEEKRILFVAATRAKDALTFYRPRFNGQGNLTSMSEYEPVIAPHVDMRRHAREGNAGNVKVDSTKKIDIRTKLMMGAKR